VIFTTKQRELIERLKRDSDFSQFAELLTQIRESRRSDLEAATTAIQSHKLQGYCSALSDLISLCSKTQVTAGSPAP